MVSYAKLLLFKMNLVAKGFNFNENHFCSGNKLFSAEQI